ncbi:unnamed protein product [Caretta caretta]
MELKQLEGSARKGSQIYIWDIYSIVSNNAMAGGQESIRVIVWTCWILTVVLMVWSHQASGQGQGVAEWLLCILDVWRRPSAPVILSKILWSAENHLLAQWATKETHTDLAAKANWWLEWGDRVYFSHLTVRTAGVVTLFSPNLRPEVLGVAEALPGRLLHLRVHLEGLVVNLVNVYALTSGPERLHFFQQASAFLGTLDPHECLVLGGDFNTILEEGDRSGTEQCPAAADILREIVDHHSLVDVWRDHHPDDASMFTFVRVEARRSRYSWLDRIYLSRFHLSQAHSSSIRPAPFSDHHLATVTVSLCAEKPGPAYWHFNNSLLEDVGFVASFREFWLAWRGQRHAFPSARWWWDLGLFCHDYTRGASRQRDAAIGQLEREVLELERRLAASPEDPSLCRACREKREELRALEDHRARGAFVRSRIRLLREMDRSSRFFYALEKEGGQEARHLSPLRGWYPPHGSGGDVREGQGLQRRPFLPGSDRS